MPSKWEDFPPGVIDAVNIYHNLGDRVYPEIGFIGKDYTNFDFLLRDGYSSKEFTFEVCQWLERRQVKNLERKLKQNTKDKKKKIMAKTIATFEIVAKGKNISVVAKDTERLGKAVDQVDKKQKKADKTQELLQ